jgi:hypothetical protein
MKSVICLLLLIISDLVIYGKELTYSYQNQDKDLILKANLQKIENSKGSGIGFLFNYKVFFNEKRVGSFPQGGGEIEFCGYTPPRVNGVSSPEKQIGWMILGNEVCGNTNSLSVEIIIPDIQNEVFLKRSFISKVRPVQTNFTGGVAFWFSSQNWGKGNTAQSFFTLQKFIIMHDGDSPIIRHGNILVDLQKYEKECTEKWLRPNFLSLFSSGIRDANPYLMQYALENYYNRDDIQWYKAHFPDPSRKTMKKLIDRMTVTRELNEEVGEIGGWTFPSIGKSILE